MSAKRSLLVVGEDRALRRSLCVELNRSGEFACFGCDPSERGLARAAGRRLDAILLDAGRDPEAEMRLAGRLHLLAPATPLFILAEIPQEGAAAEDRIAKPVRISELVIRLRARLGQNGARPVSIGPYAFRPEVKLLVDWASGREVRLTEKETAILEFLLRAGSRVTGRDTLLGEVWGYHSGVTTHTLETHIYRLRHKIEPDPAHAQIVITEPGGYRLVP